MLCCTTRWHGLGVEHDQFLKMLLCGEVFCPDVPHAARAPDMRLLRPPCSAVIFAPHDTPYACGAFAFDILLPADYPNRPPQASALGQRRAGQAGVVIQPALQALREGGPAVLVRAAACPRCPRPLQVHFLTTGGGRVRFNPNL